MALSVLELCAGAGGQAIGLEWAGFEHSGAVEIDQHACETLKANRPAWNVIRGDLRQFDARSYRGTDLVAGGVPCPPFSIAGRQLGKDDERDLFPEAIRIVSEVRPTAIMLENVPGFASNKFCDYRTEILYRIGQLGYEVGYSVLNASNYRVPQLRPRCIVIGLKTQYARMFRWPVKRGEPKTVGETLVDLMSARLWPGAQKWSMAANSIAPTLVGGSKKHGGPDLGPTRARKQWSKLRVDGLGLADLPPSPEFPSEGSPRLTARMAARIQGFPDDWEFSGKKTAQYRQVGNAFPPPVAEAVGLAIKSALTQSSASKKSYHYLYQPSPPENQLQLAF